MTERPFVKVCGVVDPAIARAAVRAGADYLGLVFAPSARRVDPDRARRLVDAVPASWVGVFADAPEGEAERACRDLDLAAVQLHGREDEERCRRVREATGRTVWKAVRWDGRPESVERFAGAVDAVLVDAAADGRGGTGRTLPWREIAERWPVEARSVPLVLAGGLEAGNVVDAVRIVRPAGVDASSRLERSPGVKDPALVTRFVEAIRDAFDPVTAETR